MTKEDRLNKATIRTKSALHHIRVLAADDNLKYKKVIHHLKCALRVLNKLNETNEESILDSCATAGDVGGSECVAVQP